MSIRILSVVAVLSSVLFSGAFAMAAVGDIKCTAQHRVISSLGIKEEEVVPMVKDHEDIRSIHFIAEVRGRTFALSGDPMTGNYTISQTWGVDYAEGILVSATFDNNGHMQVSSVETLIVDDSNPKNPLYGSRVYKLECDKVLASAFPKE
jgi:hypothetical protein